MASGRAAGAAGSSRQLGLLLLLAACASCANAYPSIFVARYAQQCTDHPHANFGKVHEYTAAPDTTVAFTVRDSSGKAVAPAAGGATPVCAGDSYRLEVVFGAPSQRNFLLTSSHGSFVAANNDCDAWCPNRVCSPAPAPGTTVAFTLPCGTDAGTKVNVTLTSANGRIPTPGSTLRTTALSLVSVGKCPNKCGGTTAEKSAPKKKP